MALDGSTSSFIPYTLNGLQDIAVDSSTVSTLQVNSLVPNRAVVSDGSNYLISSNATSQELEYLSGTTSNIQTQISSKASTSYVDTNFLNKTTVSAQSVAGETTFLTGAKFDYITASKIPIIDANKKLVSSGVDSIKITYLDNVSSDIQTQLNSKSNLSGGNSFTGSQTYLDQIASRVAVFDGSKNLVSSSVSTTTLSYLDATSSIQNQLNSKANLSGGNTFTGSQTYSDQTASRVAVFDGSKNMVSSSVTTTTLSYLDATSSIQSQLNSKSNLSGGNTFSGLQTYNDGIRLNASPTGNFTLSTEYIDPFTQNLLFSSSLGSTIKFTGDYGFINSTGWTPNKVSVVDTNGNLVTSSISTTELSYLSGVSSNLQTQLNSKSSIVYVDQQTTRLPRYADVRTGIAPAGQPAFTMSWYFGTHNNNSGSDFSDLLLPNGWSDSSGGKVNLLSFNKGTKGIRQFQGTYGSLSNFSDYYDCVMTDLNSGNVTLNGNLAMGSNKVRSSGIPTLNDDYTNKLYVDSITGLYLPLSGGTMTGSITMGANKITTSYTPINAEDLTRKGYVDTQDGLRLLKSGDTATGTIYNTGGNFHPYKGGDLNRGVVLFANDADGASYSTFNGGLASWYGIGFTSTLDGITRYVFDTRTGNSAQVGTMTAGGINNTGATANRVAIFDVNKNLVSSSVTDTTLTYLDIGSSLTGILATKANLSGAAFSGAISAPTMGIGTASSGVYTLYVNGASYTNGYAYVNGNIFQYGADFNIQNAVRGAGGRALVHDVSNVLALNYGGDFSSVRIDSNVSLGTNAITSTSNPTTADQLTRKGYVDTGLALKADLSGATFTGEVIIQKSGRGWRHEQTGGVRLESYIDAAAGWLGTYTNHPLYFYTNNSGELMSLTTAGALKINGLTANRVLITNASKELISSSVTDTTLTYLDIGSSLTSLLNLKANLAGSNTFTGTNTFSSSTPITLSGLTADRVLITNASSELKTSTVTTTTLGYLDATSSVQTQLNSKASITYVDNADALRVLKAGDTMTGLLNVNIANTYANRAANPLPSNFVASSTGGRLYMGAYYTGGAGVCGTIQASDYYSSADHGVDLLLNPLGGNVGIGISGPRETLDVTGNIVTAWNNYRIGTQYLSSSSGYYLGMENNVSTRVCAIVAQSADSPATGAVVFRTGSGPNERMRINASGQVGIGTVSLTDLFQVQGTASFSGDVGIGAVTKTGIQLRLADSVQNRKIVLYDGGFADNHQFYGFGINGNTLRFNVPVAANDRFSFFAGTSSTASTEVARINGNGSAWYTGSVGIGTTDPNTMLHLYKITDCSIRLQTSAVDNGYLVGTNAYTFLSANWAYDGTITNVGRGSSQIVCSQPTAGGYITLATSPNVNTAVVERMRVTSNGNVGIGTATPQGDLHVQLAGAVNDYWGKLVVKTTSYWGDGTATRSETAGTQYATMFPMMFLSPHIVSDTDGWCPIRMGRSGGVSTGRWWEMAVRADGRFQIGIERSSQFVIDTTGNIGISTITPYSSLHISRSFTTNGDTSGMISFENIAAGGYLDWMIGPQVIDGTAIFSLRGKADGLNNLSNIINVNGGTGNVAIGTIPSSYTFDVNGATNVTGAIRAYGNGVGGPSPIYSQNDVNGDGYANIYLRNNSGSGCYWFLNSSGRTGDGGSNTATLRNDIGTLRLQALSNIGIIIKGNSEYVGVGTTSPTGALDVYSTTADYTNNLLVRAPWAGITFDNTQIASGRKWHLFSGGVGAGIGAGNFGIWDGTANAYRFSINSIGTVTCHQALDVSGNLAVTSTVPTATTFNNTSNRLVFNDGGLRSAACSFWTYYNLSVAWTYGLTVNNAFYVPNTTCCILITFTASHYVGGAIGSWVDILITPNGTITPSVNPMPAFFFNLGGVHTQVNHQFVIQNNAWGASTVGWKQIYFQGNTGGGATASDVNDTLAYTVTIIG